MFKAHKGDIVYVKRKGYRHFGIYAGNDHVIHYHKERWDGSGKPEGLKAHSIPLGSRIIAVADAYCALRTERAHRKAFSKEEAMKIIREEAEIKWDPMLVDILEAVSE